MHQYELRRRLTTCIQIWCDRMLVYFLFSILLLTIRTNSEMFPSVYIRKAYCQLQNYQWECISLFFLVLCRKLKIYRIDGVADDEMNWKRKKKKLCLPIHVWIASRKCSMLVVGGSSTCVPAIRSRMYFLFSVWRYFFYLLRFWFRLWKTNLFISKRM